MNANTVGVPGGGAGTLFANGQWPNSGGGAAISRLFIGNGGVFASHRDTDSTWTPWVRLDSSGPDVQVFTASGTWNKPAGYPDDALVKIEAWGGGGGGQGDNRTTGRKGGGQGGSYMTLTKRLGDLPASLAVAVGAGGVGGFNSGSPVTATSGGNSSVGSLVVASGGRRGYDSTSTLNGPGSLDGQTFSQSGPDLAVLGHQSVTTPGFIHTYPGGSGGESPATARVVAGNRSMYAGRGGDSGYTGSPAEDGAAPAGGGGGAHNTLGGNGARGEVRISVMG